MSMTNINSEIDRLQRELIDAKVDLNIKDNRIRELERDLLSESRQVRSLELNTQEVKRLEILEYNKKDEDSFDPRQTGTFDKDIWNKVR